jgi:hypothetical protein
VSHRLTPFGHRPSAPPPLDVRPLQPPPPPSLQACSALRSVAMTSTTARNRCELSRAHTTASQFTPLTRTAAAWTSRQGLHGRLRHRSQAAASAACARHRRSANAGQSGHVPPIPLLLCIPNPHRTIQPPFPSLAERAPCRARKRSKWPPLNPKDTNKQPQPNPQSALILLLCTYTSAVQAAATSPAS